MCRRLPLIWPSVFVDIKINPRNLPKESITVHLQSQSYLLTVGILFQKKTVVKNLDVKCRYHMGNA